MSKHRKAKTLSFAVIITIIAACCLCVWLIGILLPASSNLTNTTTINTPETTQQEEVKGISTQEEPPTPTCTQDEETSRSCIDCKKAKITYTNSDCSTATKEVTDESCTANCPAPAAIPVPAPEPTPQPAPQPAPAPAPQPVDYCCKHCTNSKACGNSCISIKFTCHQPPGCACDY